MNKKVILIGVFTILTSMLITACNTNNNQDPSDPSNAMMEIELPDPLTAEESEKYKSDLPVEEKITLAKELAKQMPKDGLDQMEALFPDLNKTKKIANEDPKNMMKMGQESWYYTEEGNLTIVICDSVRSPIYVFEGDEVTEENINEAMNSMTGNSSSTTEEDNSSETEEVETDESESDELSSGTTITAVASYKTEEPVYEDFSQEKYEELKGSKPVVLFFHAEWCPTCKQIEGDVTTELSNFPKGTKILQADFDTENELKAEYDIVVQSTLVVLDADGNVVEKLAAPSNSEIISTINDSL